MSRTRLLVCAAVAVTTALVAPAVPAAAADAPESTVVLTISDGHEIAPVRNVAVLKCDPIDGDHPHAADACTQLAPVRGDFRALHVVEHHLCPMIYKPVTVAAFGYWRGDVVDFHQTYANECFMLGRTGSVFDF